MAEEIQQIVFDADEVRDAGGDVTMQESDVGLIDNLPRSYEEDQEQTVVAIVASTGSSAGQPPRVILSPRKLQAKTRRDKFVRNGKTLQQLAKKLQIDTQCSLYLKAQLKTATGHRTIVVGENFELVGEAASPSKPGLSLTDVSKVVSDSIKASVSPIVESLRGQIASTRTAEASISPRKRIAPSRKTDACWICGSVDFVKDYRTYPTVWLVCSGDGKPCKMSVHAECIGFQALTEAEVTNMPDIYCAQHWGFGRVAREMDISTVNENAEETAQPIKPTRKTAGSRRARGKKN